MPPSNEQLEMVKQRGEEAERDERYPAAIELLSAYVQHRPDDAFAWYRLGNSLGNIDLTNEAERALLRCVELLPEQWRFHSRLGMVYKHAGDWEEAARWFASAIALPDADKVGWLWIMRGAALAVGNQLKEAEACHRRAIELDVEEVDEAWHNLGLVLRAQGRYQEAAAACRVAAQLDPSVGGYRETLEGMSGVDEAMRLARALGHPLED